MYLLGNQEAVCSQDNPDPQVCQYVEVGTIVYNQGNQDNQVCQYVAPRAMMDSRVFRDNQEHQDNQGRLVDQAKKDLLLKALLQADISVSLQLSVLSSSFLWTPFNKIFQSHSHSFDIIFYVPCAIIIFL